MHTRTSSSSPKAMNIFRDAGVKSLEWTPVGIEE